tara:strand:+ start:308 stop:547 length:240 start_codon:yes stop_codon:yes gene_type:complete
MNKPNEYIVHNYSAVDQHIEELTKREVEITRAIQLKNRRENRKNAIKTALRNVILLCGLGIFAMLFAFAIRLLVYSPLS